MGKTIKQIMRRDQILLSAIAVIKREGFLHTTMEDISTELEMTKGSLYYYFKNKKDLMSQCHKLILSSAIEQIEQFLKGDETAENQLRYMIAVHIEYAIEEKEIYNMIIEPEQAFHKSQLESVLKLRRYYQGLFDKVIQKGIENKEFQTEDPMLVRMMILGAMNWIQQWYKLDGEISKDKLKQKYGDNLIKLLK